MLIDEPDSQSVVAIEVMRPILPSGRKVVTLHVTEMQKELLLELIGDIGTVADLEPRAVVEVLRRDLPFDRLRQIMRIDVGPEPGQGPEIGGLHHHFFSAFGAAIANSFEFVITYKVPSATTGVLCIVGVSSR